MGDIVTLYLTAGKHQIIATIDAETICPYRNPRLTVPSSDLAVIR